MTSRLEHVAGLRADLLEGPVPVGADPGTDRERVELITQMELLTAPPRPT
ncbi:hypothetical protein GCM10023226_26020 [Nocardioides nanhaiensis]|uniref:Uncharacterized protein n=1 Tax=Nocardioides nanhaiensis TaxID=1476871 RepID=A0ABP8WEE5_9ACTN